LGSALIAFLALAVPVAVLGTTGLNIESQHAVLAKLDEAGTREITVVSTTGEEAIPESAVERIGRLTGVDWVVGLGPVSDIDNASQAGGPTPMRRYNGIRAPVLFGRSVTGSSGLAGYVSKTSVHRLGLAGAFGEAQPGSIQIVGWFSAAGPLASLDAFVLVPDHGSGGDLERLVVSVADVGWVVPVADSIDSLLGSSAAASTTVQTSAALLSARAVVQDEVTQRDRFLILALLGAAMLMACAVIFAMTLVARKDFGRRRALGATRVQLALLVLLSALWPSLVGSALGVALGYSYVDSELGYLADWPFPLSVGVLTVAGLALATTIPAVIAATRDPLRVLRVP
jgi:putative ABC transport system permease protein